MPLGEHTKALQVLGLEGWIGLTSDLPARAIPPVGAAVAENCTIRNGIVERILGYQQHGATASGICYGAWQYKKHHPTDGTVTLQEIVLFGTALTDYSTPGSPASIGSLTGAVYATAAQAGNRMFFSNGSDTPKVWDGSTLQEVNCPVPTTPIDEGTPEINTGGYLETDGAYEVRTTFYDPVNADESNPSVVLARTMTTGPGETDLIWRIEQPATAAVPARFTKLRVYRSEKSLKEHRYESEVSITPASGEAEISVGTSQDGDLAFELEVSTNNDDMPSYQIIFFWDNRLWGLGDPANPTLLGYSKALQYMAWDVETPMELGQKDGIPLRGMGTHPLAKDRLFVFKRAKAFQVAQDYSLATTPGEVIYGSTEIPGGTGLLDHWAMAQKDGYLWGVGDSMLWRFDGSGFAFVSDGAFNDEMARWKSASNAVPLFMVPDDARDRGELLLCCRDSAGQQAFLYNTRSGGLTKYTPGSPDVGSWVPAVWERDDGRDWIVAGSRDGKVYELWESSTRGTAIVTYVTAGLQKFRTGAIDPDPGTSHKMFRWVDVVLWKPTTNHPDESDAYQLYPWYDDVVATPTPYEFGPYSTVTDNMQVFRVGLDGRHAQCVSFEIRTKTNGKAFRLAGLRVGWRPVGQLFRL